MSRLPLAGLAVAALATLFLRVRPETTGAEGAAIWRADSPGGSFALLLKEDAGLRRVGWSGNPEALRIPMGSSPDTLLFLPGERALALRGGRRIAESSIHGPKSGERIEGVGVASQAAVRATALRRLEPVRFEDRFSRNEAGSAWKPVRGLWELRGFANPEESVNPFSAVARFRERRMTPEFLEQRRGRRDPTGLGVIIRMNRIVRVQGGGPAAEAGVEVGDTIESVDGEAVSPLQPVVNRLAGVPGTRVTLRLGPERDGPEIVIDRREVYWADVERWFPLSPGPVARPAILAAGDPMSRNYALRATVTPMDGASAFGLAFDVVSASDWSAFRWRALGSGRGVVELVRSEGGALTTLAARPLAFLPAQPYRMGISLKGSSVSADINGNPVLSASDAARGAGRFGLWADGPSDAAFDDVLAEDSGGSEENPSFSLTERFIRDRYMEEWSDPAREWAAPDSRGDRAYACRIPKDYRLEIPAGPAAEVRIGEGTGAAEFRIPADQGAEIRVQDGVAHLAGQPPRPLPAGVQPIRVRGIPAAPLSHVRLQSPQKADYTFENAPNEWEVRRGEWGLMNRWVCDPRWSWFGGWNADGVASIWNTRVFGGDFLVDVHVGPLMRAVNSTERAGDINVTVLGDGRNLASGYCLIIGGGNNAWSRFSRDGKTLWHSTDRAVRLPEQARRGGNLLHKYWFHVRIQREGGRIQAFLNEQPLFSIVDPDPLPEGRLGIWTKDNGILVARTRIVADRLGRPGIPAAEPPGSEDVRIRRTFGAGGDACELEVNRAAALPPCPIGPQFLDAGVRPLVSFEASIRPGTAVDLVFSCRGRRYRIRLTGPAEDPPGVSAVGENTAIPADGKAHDVRLDLERILRTRFKDTKPLYVTDLSLRAFGSEYAEAGFGASPAGSGYRIRNFRADPRP